jgi:hypothetical protein
MWYTLAVALIFLITAAVFGFYDIFMEQRQRKILRAAVEARALVASLFPAQVRDRVFESQRKMKGKVKKMLRLRALMRNSSQEGSKTGSPTGSHAEAEDRPADAVVFDRRGRRPSLVSQSTLRLKTYLSGSSDSLKFDAPNSRPIADLFPHTTVLFGDIAVRLQKCCCCNIETIESYTD